MPATNYIVWRAERISLCPWWNATAF